MTPSEPSLKRCPFCAEEIQAAAVVCRFCGRELAVATPAPAPTPPSAPLPLWGKLLFAGIGLMVVGSVIAQAIQAYRTPHPPPRPEPPILQVKGSIIGGALFTLENPTDEALTSITLEVLSSAGGTTYTCREIDRLAAHDKTTMRFDNCTAPDGARFNPSVYVVDHINVEASVGGSRRSSTLSFRK